MADKPINFSEIEQEWQTTNPEGEALPPTIQCIVAQRITNNPNGLQLINRIKADHQEQRRKLKNRVSPRSYTSNVHMKHKTPQPTITKTQAYDNKYKVLYIEDTDNDEDLSIEETPLVRRVEKTKTPIPIFNNDWDQIDNFI